MNPNMRNVKLRGVMEDLGFRNVETVISSGNVVFDADSSSAGALEAKIEAAWPEQLGFQSTTFVRTRKQLQGLLENDPFEGRDDNESGRLQTTFLKHEPDHRIEVPFTPSEGDYTIVSVGDRVVCSTVDLTGSRTPGLMRWLEQTFGTEITTRTWKTLNRIVQRMN